MDFACSIASMPTECANAGEFAGFGPTGHCLGIHAKKCCHFRWSEEVLGIRILARHCASYRVTERVFAAHVIR